MERACDVPEGADPAVSESAGARRRESPRFAAGRAVEAARRSGALDAAVGVAGEPALGARVHRVVRRPRPAAEPGALVVEERLLDLLASVHHERTMLHHRLADRLALQDEQLD